MKKSSPLFEKPSRTYSELHKTLHEYMESKNFKVGDKLPAERALATTFGVSRSSIRNAIHKLSESGFLESRHGNGTYIIKPELENFKSEILNGVTREADLFDQVMEFRWIIEPQIAELAALRRTDEQLKQLKVIICEQHLCLKNKEDDGHLDAQFHYVLAQCTNNQLLISAVQEVNKLYVQGRISELRDEEWRTFSISTHLEILEGLLNKSPAMSRKSVENHLNHIVKKHIFSIDRNEKN